MLAAAVAGVDHRDGRILGGDARSAVERMAHDDEVGVGGNHADGIGEALALGAELACMSAELMTAPPSRCIADSKLRRVRVDGS